MTRDEAIDVLAEEIQHRREGCVLLLAVCIASAVNAMNMTQDDVDEAFRRASWSRLRRAARFGVAVVKDFFTTATGG